jgi:hypothetical protein
MSCLKVVIQNINKVLMPGRKGFRKDQRKQPISIDQIRAPYRKTERAKKGAKLNVEYRLCVLFERQEIETKNYWALLY